MEMPKIVPVILCGGAGERLWPYSNEQKTKAFLTFADDQSLLQKTAQRLRNLPVNDVVVVTLDRFKEEACAQVQSVLPEIECHSLGEPMGRGTLPAIIKALLYARDQWPDAWLWVMPCDHHFSADVDFTPALHKALGNMHAVTAFGVKPESADPAYGYMRADGRGRVTDFIEKPDKNYAARLVDDGYMWNTALYMVRVDVLYNLVARSVPGALALLEKRGSDAYPLMKTFSFERDVLTGCDDLNLVELSSAWNDVGRWKSVWEMSEKDTNGNVLQGNVLCDNVQDSLVYGGGRVISCIGLKNTVVIDAEDTVLVAHIDSAESLRTLIAQAKELRQTGRTLHYKGSPEIIEELLSGKTANG